MPITPHLKGPYYFDLETRRALGITLELACIALSAGDDDDHVRRTIADKLIALARTGERNPDVLCDKALEAICRPDNLEKPSTGTVGRSPVSLASSAPAARPRASWPAVIEGS
jgi:hypothetical protein